MTIGRPEADGPDPFEGEDFSTAADDGLGEALDDGAEVDEGLDEDPRTTREELRRRMKTEGARAAYAALVDVCRDPKAPAPAKATAATSLLRAGGFLGKAADEADPDEKPIEQMTAAEMLREVQRLDHRLEARERALRRRRPRRS